MKRALLTFVALLLIGYLSAYPVMRWRSVLVREVFYSVDFKVGSLEHRIRAGRDSRSTGTGALKNAIAPFASWLYTPLRIIEAAYWNAG